MIGVFLIVLMDLLAEKRHRITDEQMGDVLRQQMINIAIAQFLVNVLVIRQRHIIVSASGNKSEQ